MNAVRYVTIEWIGSADRHGAERVVVRDTAGREATFPGPGADQALESLLALFRSEGLRALRVELRSGLSASAGGRIYYRRLLLRRHVDVHAGLAVALAQKLGLELLVDDRVFGVEAVESAVESLLDETETTIH
jgi:hypothetical protein